MNKKVKNKLILIVFAIGFFHAVAFNPKVDNSTITLQDDIVLASDNLEKDSLQDVIVLAFDEKKDTILYPPFPPPGSPILYPDTIPPYLNPFIRFIETIVW